MTSRERYVFVPDMDDHQDIFLVVMDELEVERKMTLDIERWK